MYKLERWVLQSVTVGVMATTSDVNSLRMLEDRAAAAAARVGQITRADEAARAELADCAAQWHQAGASLRTIAASLGMNHVQVKRMIDQTDRPYPRSVVPIISAHQLLEYYLPSFGEPERAIVTFNEGDMLLSAGIHPAAYASVFSALYLPNLLLFNAAGDALGIQDANCGYGGTGPSNTEWLLKRLDWPADQIPMVFTHRYLELSRSGPIRAEADPISHIRSSSLTVLPDGGIHIRPTRRDLMSGPGKPGISREQRHNYVHNGEGNLAKDWIAEVFDATPRFPWADGVRVARCYLSHEAIAKAGLRDRGLSYSGPSFASVIIEQGDSQLWCQTSVPLDYTEHFSDATLKLLDIAGLAQERASTPTRWLRKLFGGVTQKPDFIDVSVSGQSTLRRDPTDMKISAQTEAEVS